MGMKASHGQGCTYRVEVKTGDLDWAGIGCGTVRLDLCATSNSCFLIVPDLASYGTLPPPYFRRRNLDVFTFPVSQPCQRACRIIITLNPGSCRPGWYLDYVNVQAFDGDVLKFGEHIDVHQWLAICSKLQVAGNQCPTNAAPAQLASVLSLQSAVA
ncbi:hypothetical protein Cgig2_027620 [Carnegiea gigantea]|uniref:PLAT domain-containing protein n=1 Tax=Carnegiea gigantea TaxID=171969 RepID=A0A9Q1K706_9CARY|nr:hypothetical protein Cgig2_027620 [Carnegiea gigantea]